MKALETGGICSKSPAGEAAAALKDYTVSPDWKIKLYRFKKRSGHGFIPDFIFCL